MRVWLCVCGCVCVWLCVCGSVCVAVCVCELKLTPCLCHRGHSNADLPKDLGAPPRLLALQNGPLHASPMRVPATSTPASGALPIRGGPSTPHSGAMVPHPDHASTAATPNAYARTPRTPGGGDDAHSAASFAVTVKFIAPDHTGRVHTSQSCKFDFAAGATVADLERAIRNAVVDHRVEVGRARRQWVPLYPPGVKSTSSAKEAWTPAKQTNLAEALGCVVTNHADGSVHVLNVPAEVGVIEAGHGASGAVQVPGTAAAVVDALHTSPIKTRRHRSHNQPTFAPDDDECVCCAWRCACGVACIHVWRSRRSLSHRVCSYYTIPDANQLAQMTDEELSRVVDFTVGRTGYGRITWDGATDVRGLHLSDLVRIGDREVAVYCNVHHKPAVGQGLNKPAIVQLEGVLPPDKAQYATDPAR